MDSLKWHTNYDLSSEIPETQAQILSMQCRHKSEKFIPMLPGNKYKNQTDVPWCQAYQEAQVSCLSRFKLQFTSICPNNIYSVENHDILAPCSL